MFLALAVLLMSSQSFATGGTHCEGENDDVKVFIGTVTSRSDGSLVQLNASVEFKKTLAQDVRGTDFDKSSLTKYKKTSRGTKLSVSYTEVADPFAATVSMELKTKADSDVSEGTVKIKKIINTVSGKHVKANYAVKVICSVDE